MLKNTTTGMSGGRKIDTAVFGRLGATERAFEGVRLRELEHEREKEFDNINNLLLLGPSHVGCCSSPGVLMYTGDALVSGGCVRGSRLFSAGSTGTGKTCDHATTGSHPPASTGFR